ncbi:endonuclease V [Methanocella sp. MCL-LM]|uniref:endonuclease V n=1 Tax=Methanocella sp. MCL-LM TaxID=3412035 RepID=UPI003C722D6F
MKVDALYREQEQLAKKAVFYDAFGKLDSIAGIDCSYYGDLIIGGAVVIDLNTLEPVEKAHTILKLDFPYIPGLLAYREAKAMISACRKLKSDVDVLMIDGFGTNHPRRCGIATQIGLQLEMPTIGVGKSFLCGNIRDDGYVYQGAERTGKLIYSSRSKKPVYVSPGHRISLDTSVELVEKCMKSDRIPEPTRLAHEYVTGVKNTLK